MDAPEPITILGIAMQALTEIRINFSNGSNVKVTVEQLLALQTAASGSKPTFERTGEP